jgi:hypothetical protein
MPRRYPRGLLLLSSALTSISIFFSEYEISTDSKKVRIDESSRASLTGLSVFLHQMFIYTLVKYTPNIQT